MNPLRTTELRACHVRMSESYIPRVLDHPCHLLGGAFASSDDEVALILPVLVVHDDQEFAARERSQRIFHGVEGELRPLGHRVDLDGPPWVRRGFLGGHG